MLPFPEGPRGVAGRFTGTLPARGRMNIPQNGQVRSLAGTSLWQQGHRDVSLFCSWRSKHLPHPEHW